MGTPPITPNLPPMGVLLRGNLGDFALNNRSWATLLRLAWDQGWRPAGTTPPVGWERITHGDPGRKWNSADYVTCRGQGVRADDARALSRSLAKILDDLPNHDALSGADVIRIDAPGCLPHLYISEERTLHPFEILGGPNKPALEAFVRFCAGGGFLLW